MLGSINHFFTQSSSVLVDKRNALKQLLEIKDYDQKEIEVYLKAYDYFCLNPQAFDGATIVKDLCDLKDLDLDAMLHDYHYLVYKVGSSFSIKWKTDWLYAKGNERKGKGQYSAFSRFIGLTIISIGFVPFTYLKKGKLSESNKINLLHDYKTLIKN